MFSHLHMHVEIVLKYPMRRFLLNKRHLLHVAEKAFPRHHVLSQKSDHVTVAREVIFLLVSDVRWN
jgi:hypothetical protein